MKINEITNTNINENLPSIGSFVKQLGKKLSGSKTGRVLGNKAKQGGTVAGVFAMMDTQTSLFDIFAIVALFGEKYRKELSAILAQYNYALEKNNCSLRIRKLNSTDSQTAEKFDPESFNHQTIMIKKLEEFRKTFTLGLSTIVIGAAGGGKLAGSLPPLLALAIGRPGISGLLTVANMIPGVQAITGTWMIENIGKLLRDNSEAFQSFSDFLTKKFVTHYFFAKSAPCTKGIKYKLPTTESLNLVNDQRNLQMHLERFLLSDIVIQEGLKYQTD